MYFVKSSLVAHGPLGTYLVHFTVHQYTNLAFIIFSDKDALQVVDELIELRYDSSTHRLGQLRTEVGGADFRPLEISKTKQDIHKR